MRRRDALAWVFNSTWFFTGYVIENKYDYLLYGGAAISARDHKTSIVGLIFVKRDLGRCKKGIKSSREGCCKKKNRTLVRLGSLNEIHIYNTGWRFLISNFIA
jgi:hypothetical protein